MVALGADSASKIYRNLKDEEVEQLTLEVATLPKLESEDMDEVLVEFYEMCLAQKYIVEGGVDYAKDILEKAFGMQNARNVIEKVIVSIGSKSFDFMKKTDPRQLYNFIQNEHPQTIALILVHATKFQASNVLGLLSKEKQVEVVERIAKMDRTSPDTIKEVEDMLRKRLSAIGASDVGDMGGVKYTAELLNSVDRGTERFIFDNLEKKDPELVEEIRKLMFVFEDITALDDVAMQLLAREVDPKDLVAALKTANDELKDAFFRNMSKRNAENIQEDIEYARGIRSRDVEAAQQRIVSKVRELEEGGQIVISRGGEDDIV
ncbi:MAG: flagellar motor switch protein FliG [Oscillospiraceae bacterium]|nr:flagellar motor switch protein FliG [Oscillospiraceae bacterium]